MIVILRNYIEKYSARYNTTSEAFVDRADTNGVQRLLVFAFPFGNYLVPRHFPFLLRKVRRHRDGIIDPFPTSRRRRLLLLLLPLLRWKVPKKGEHEACKNRYYY